MVISSTLPVEVTNPVSKINGRKVCKRSPFIFIPSNFGPIQNDWIKTSWRNVFFISFWWDYFYFSILQKDVVEFLCNLLNLDAIVSIQSDGISFVFSKDFFKRGRYFARLIFWNGCEKMICWDYFYLNLLNFGPTILIRSNFICELYRELYLWTLFVNVIVNLIQFFWNFANYHEKNPGFIG